MEGDTLHIQCLCMLFPDMKNVSVSAEIDDYDVIDDVIDDNITISDGEAKLGLHFFDVVIFILLSCLIYMYTKIHPNKIRFHIFDITNQIRQHS